ncbi:MAG: type II secretion system F family protein [Vulcanimicrobiota bacterium]
MQNLSRELRSLALLLGQGQSLAAALHRLGTQNEFWEKAALKVETGSDWTQVAAPLPPPLNRLLPDQEFSENLRLCARLLEDQQKRRRFWRNVCIYPVLLCLAGLVLGLFVSLVTQAEARFLGEAGGLMRALTMASRFYLAYFPWLCLLLLCLAGLLTRPGPRQSVPVLGLLARLQDSVAFFRWLELARRQHTSLPEAVELASQGCVLPTIRESLQRLAEELRAGSELRQTTSKLPALASWALSQAEAGAFQPARLLALADLLEQKHQFYEEFAAALMSLGGYLLAGGMALWCSLCVLLPLRNVSAL